MMHVIYVLRLAKGTSWDETTLNNEDIKTVALSIVELYLVGDIS